MTITATSKGVRPDTSAWLDQVEQARNTLMLVLRSRPLPVGLGRCVGYVDADIQKIMDRMIDDG